MRYAVGVGCFLLLVALGAVAWDLYFMSMGGQFKLSSWGEFWYGAHSPSLNGFKTFVEGDISVGLWRSFFRPFLNLPALLLFGLPGLVLATLPWTLPRIKAMKKHRKQAYRPEQPTA